MARVTTCDGTGVEIPDDTPVTGLFGHQYCDEVRPIAEKYLAELNELHTLHAQRMQADLQVLRDRYRLELRELPDDV